MYEYISGKLIEKNTLFVIIDVQGVGYKLHTPVNLLGKLPVDGQNVFLYASWVVREMSQTLYGFVSKEERDLFELLITLSGIGPKTALSIVSHFDASQLNEAVHKGKSEALTHVPGIGKKTAERLIVDLKGRLKFAPLSKTGVNSTKMHDALNALMHLGYSQANAEQAIKKALAELNEECDLPSLISLALRYQRSGAGAG